MATSGSAAVNAVDLRAGQITGQSATGVDVYWSAVKQESWASAMRGPRLVLFFELFFFRRTEAGRRAQRLTIIEQRQVADVQRE